MSAIGQIITIDLPERTPQGVEQEGDRPAIVVADFNLVGKVRYDLIVVVPLTSASKERLRWQRRAPDLYPILPAGAGGGGIPVASIVLLDQVTAVDPKRVKRFHGTLTPAEYQPLADGLRMGFALGAGAAESPVPAVPAVPAPARQPKK